MNKVESPSVGTTQLTCVELLSEARQGQRAAAEFRKMLDHPGVVGNFVTCALAHLQLARAEAMSGNREAARRDYQEFLTLLKDANPELPVLKQAKAEYARLS